MEKTRRVELKAEWIKSLGQLLDQPIGIMSPFAALDNVEPRNDKDEWNKLGITDEKGVLVPEWRTAFNVLADPEAYARVKLVGGEDYWEYVVYFRPETGETAGLHNTSEGLIMHYPAAADDILDYIKMHTGDSPLQTGMFSAELTTEEAVVLTAALDIYRRQIFLAMGNDSPFQVPEFNGKEITSIVNNPSPNWQWLVDILTGGNEANQIIIDEQRTEAAIKSIEEKGFIIKQGENWILNESTQGAGNRLLIIDQMIVLEMGSLPQNNDINRMAVVCLQTGVNDLMTIESVEDQVLIEFTTSQQLLTYIEYFISEDTWFKENEKESIQPVFCSICGARLIAGNKFCSECGTSV